MLLNKYIVLNKSEYSFSKNLRYNEDMGTQIYLYDSFHLIKWNRVH